MAPVFDEEILYGVFSALLTWIPSSLMGLASYILTSIALYTLADRRGLNKPWLAWVPVLNCWILGSLSDQYRYVVKGEDKVKRRWLLCLSILRCLIGLLVAVLGAVVAFEVVSSGMFYSHEERILRQIVGPVLAIGGLCLPLAGIAIAHAVLYFMALYDVYKSMDPGNSVMFLVLSILFRVTEPFFLFFNRQKDKGMPPRREQPVCTPEPPQWQPQETWENKNYL